MPVFMHYKLLYIKRTRLCPAPLQSAPLPREWHIDALFRSGPGTGKTSLGLDGDRRGQRLAGKMRVQVGENQRGRRAPRLRSAPGDMRRDHHVVALQQRRQEGRDARFPLEDIQASPRYALRVQRVEQGLGIHDRPAPDVDEIAMRAERGEHVRVDEV